MHVVCCYIADPDVARVSLRIGETVYREAAVHFGVGLFRGTGGWKRALEEILRAFEIRGKIHFCAQKGRGQDLFVEVEAARVEAR